MGYKHVSNIDELPENHPLRKGAMIILGRAIMPRATPAAAPAKDSITAAAGTDGQLRAAAAAAVVAPAVTNSTAIETTSTSAAEPDAAGKEAENAAKSAEIERSAPPRRGNTATSADFAGGTS